MGGLGFLGYGLATRGWMMFALLLSWFVRDGDAGHERLHVPPPGTRGELQGAVAGLYSLSTIVGPPLLEPATAHTPGRYELSQ